MASFSEDVAEPQPGPSSYFQNPEDSFYFECSGDDNANPTSPEHTIYDGRRKLPLQKANFLSREGEDSSESDESERSFSGFEREEIFLRKGSNVRQTCEKRGIGSASESSSSDGSSSDPALKRGRKRQKNPKRWKANIRKKARAEGVGYRRKSGKLKSPRKAGHRCHCSKKCFEKVNEEERKHLLLQFNHIGNHSMQNQYLRGLIEATDIKRRGAGGRDGTAKGKPGKRGSSYIYSIITSANRKVPVCRKAFLSIHGIGYTRIKNLRKTAGACKPDQRGKHGNRPHKVKTEHLQNVRNHIKSFPRMASHYSRKQNNKKRYLKEGLNVQRMYNLYLEKYEAPVFGNWKASSQAQLEQREQPTELRAAVTYRRYLQVFNTEFNFGFGRPRSDTCARCEQLNLKINASEDAALKEEANEELRLHQIQAEQGYQAKARDAERAQQSWKGKRRIVHDEVTYKSVDATDMITFDLQQNLPTPNLKHNDMFYLRQLWTYNFGVHDCVSGQGYMFMWHEAMAKRGASEIASCLMTFFQRFRTGARSLVSYSDGCGGQNKNLTIIGLFSELHFAGVYEVIDHLYLERGHTYLDNDRDFGIIEKRRASAEVYVPRDWYEVVKEAGVAKPFQVVQMEQEDFLDYKASISNRYALKNKDLAGQKVLLRDVHWLNFGWGPEKTPEGSIKMVHHPNEVWIRKTFSASEPWMKVQYVRRKNPMDNVMTTTPSQLYDGPLPLKPAKVADLKKTAAQHLAPLHRSFYMNLRAEGEDSDTEYTNSDFSEDA